MLRSRKARREQPLGDHEPAAASRKGASDPKQEALFADSVGLALLVVLETLNPAERLAFVLHDMFALPFDEIAPIVGRSTEAARQLASRARRRIQGTASVSEADLSRQRQVVDAFLAATRAGDFEGLLAVLDPEVVLRIDAAVAPKHVAAEIRGASAVAQQAAKGGARAARPALVNGAVGVVVAPRGRLLLVIEVTIEKGKITAIDAIADPERLRQIDLAILDANR
jgi:RNA polymerase sigma-70 factor (ECF subfamily)